MFPGLSLGYWLTVHGLVTVLALLVYIVTAHVLQQRRHPSAAIAWVLFILLLPYFALPSFLAFGSRKLSRPSARAARPEGGAVSEDDWPVQTALALGQPAPAAYRALQLHAQGHAALLALWETIRGAQHSLDLCTFIIGRDAVGQQLVMELAARARAGVRVRLLLDGLGRLMSRHPDLRPLRAAGALVTLFVPPLHSPLKGRTNLRNHRKLLIADAGRPGSRLWCGGRNLACEYFEGRPAEAAWHDLSFDLRGPFVAQAQLLFDRDWAFANGRARSGSAAGRAAPDAPDRPAVVVASVTAPSAAATGSAPQAAPAAQLIASGPDQVDDTVHALLVTAAYRARRRIALATPYFVPDAALLSALCLAARRGVQVDLLLPARSNHRLSDLARRRALRSLADAGGRIWLLPGMLHAKLAVIDGALALAGSTNLDSRSLFLNYELMVAFHDTDAVTRCVDWFDHERQGAQRHESRRASLLADMAEGLVLWLGFQL